MSRRDQWQRERRTSSAAGSQSAGARERASPEPDPDGARLGASILLLQARVGNAAVSRWLARQPSQTAPGPTRGRVSPLANKVALIGAGVFQPIVRTTTEVVPAAGWAAYAAPGYDFEAEAVIDAQRHAEEHVVVTVVVVDSARFRVFETDATIVSSIAIPMDFVKRVCQPPAPRTQPWKKRRDQALKAAEQGQHDSLRDLVSEVTGLDDVHVAVGRQPHNAPPAAARPRGAVNVDPSFGLAGRTHNGPTRADPVGDLPEPIFVIGRDALGSPEQLRATVAHEARHAHDHRRVIRLIEDWREAGAKPAFHAWLRKRRAKIPKEIYWMAERLVGGPGGADTELFTSAESVIDLLHHAPLASLRDPISKEAGDIITNLQAFVGAHLTAGTAPANALLARLTSAIRAAGPDRARALCGILQHYPVALHQPYDAEWKSAIDALVARLKAAAGC